MHGTGFFMEDNRGREFVVVCEQPYEQPGTAFSLRGWRRRRMVPLPWTGPGLRHITGGVRRTLADLFHRLPNVSEDV